MKCSGDNLPWTMAIKSFTHGGMVPLRLFIDKSRIWRLMRWYSCKGMGPQKLFDLKIRAYNCVKFSPIQLGTLPHKLFAPIFKKFNLLQFFKAKGNSPEKLLLYKSNTSSWKEYPIEAGSFPQRLLCPRLRTRSSLKCHKQSGSFPVKELWERSRNDKNPSPIWHKKEIPP